MCSSDLIVRASQSKFRFPEDIRSSLGMELRVQMPMKMPSSTAKVCAAKEWREPPNGQKNCKSSNMKIDGAKVTWDVQCTGPTMTGHGEITRESATAYSGSIKMSMDQGNMKFGGWQRLNAEYAKQFGVLQKSKP